MRLNWAKLLGLLLCAIGQTAGAQVPAASLLVPYFEVDDATGPACGQTRNTIITMTNTAVAETLVKVTVWSDHGVGIIDFNVYFHPLDQVELDLAEMICLGNLPVTGPEEPPGSAGSPGADFPGCAAVFPFVNPVLPGSFLNRVRNGLTGLEVAGTGCAGHAHGDSVARGYVTIDSVTQCDVVFPYQAGFDATLAADDHLSGTVSYTGLDGSFDFAVPAVPVKAGIFGPGEHTFYGRYDGGLPTGEDGREALPGRFQSPLVTGGAGTTHLVYWREGSGSAAFFDCATPPSSLPGLADNVQMYDSSGARAVTTIAPPLQAGIFPWAAVLGSPARGVADIDLSHGDIAYPDPDVMAQAWVITINDPVGGAISVDPGTESTSIFRSGFEGLIDP